MGYAADFSDGNYENDFDIAIADISIERDHIHNGCVYSNINNRRQNPTLQLLSAIGNIKAIASAPDTSTSTIVSYHNKGRLVPLNNWENPHYFTIAFLYLFPFKSEGYLEQRKQPMSIEA